jgi:hypothetical protein
MTAFDAVMARQYRIVNFAVADDYHGRPPPRRVMVNFEDSELVVQQLDRKGKPRSDDNVFFPRSWNWKYHEIKRVEVFVLTTWNAARTVDRKRAPLGIRLDMGESRSYVLLFSYDFDALLEEFASHGVAVDRQPRKLNFFLIGRK